MRPSGRGAFGAGLAAASDEGKLLGSGLFYEKRKEVEQGLYCTERARGK